MPLSCATILSDAQKNMINKRYVDFLASFERLLIRRCSKNTTDKTSNRKYQITNKSKIRELLSN
jgi:hypothetical protein